MRVLYTFILKLLVDTDHPEGMCGILQPVHKGEDQLQFRNQAELIALLKSLCEKQVKIK